MVPWWQEVWNTVREEFSDLPNIAQVTRIGIRLLLACALGAVLGIEREEKRKAAGIRTHMLVALGAAIFVAVPQQAGVSLPELMRVLQGLLAGIGFLGAGCILHKQDSTNVRGLTTAAGIWVTAAIGATAGLGRDSSAILATVLAVVILTAVPKMPANESSDSKVT